MVKYVKVSLTEYDHDRLQRWADARSDKVASMAQFILKNAIEEADAKGEIPPIDASQTTPIKDTERHSTAIALRKLATEGKLTRAQASSLETIYDFPPGTLEPLTQRENGQAE